MFFYFIGITLYVGRLSGSICPIPATATGSKYAVFPKNLDQSEILVCDEPSLLFWVEKDDDRITSHALTYSDRYFIGRTVPGNQSLFHWSTLRITVPSNTCLVGTVDYLSEQLCVQNNIETYLNTATSEYQILCVYKVPQPVYSTIQPWKWVKSSDGLLPPCAVPAGKTESGEIIYVGRAYHGFETPSGYVSPSEKCCIIPWGCTTHRRSTYEVLVIEDQSSVTWERASNGELPLEAITSNALPDEVESGIGRTLTGSDLSVGITYNGIRINISQGACKDVQLLGKIPVTHRCLYIPHKGREFIYKEYEALRSLYCVNTLQHLCFNIILDSVNAVPNRIQALPLPSKMKDGLMGNLAISIMDF